MQTSVPEQARGSLVAALKPLWGCSCACITNAMSLTDLCRLGPKVIQIYPESSQSYPSTQRMVIPKIYKPGGILHLVGEGNVQDIDDIDQNHSKSLTLDKQMGGFIWFLLKPVIWSMAGLWWLGCFPFRDIDVFMVSQCLFLLCIAEKHWRHVNKYIYIICKYATHKTGHVLHDATCMVWQCMAYLPTQSGSLCVKCW